MLHEQYTGICQFTCCAQILPSSLGDKDKDGNDDNNDEDDTSNGYSNSEAPL